MPSPQSVVTRLSPKGCQLSDSFGGKTELTGLELAGYLEGLHDGMFYLAMSLWAGTHQEVEV